MPTELRVHPIVLTADEVEALKTTLEIHLHQCAEALEATADDPTIPSLDTLLTATASLHEHSRLIAGIQDRLEMLVPHRAVVIENE